MIYICSRYRPLAVELNVKEAEKERNIERAKTAAFFVSELGFEAMCPHLYTNQFLDDDVAWQMVHCRMEQMPSAKTEVRRPTLLISNNPRQRIFMEVFIMADKKFIQAILEGRASYLNVFEPRAMGEGGQPMYSLCLIIPKFEKEKLTRLYKMVDVAKQIGKEQLWGGVIPEKLTEPIHDGNAERPTNPVFKDCVYLNIKSQNKPGVLGMDKKPLLDPMEIYSGCYVYVSVNIKPYNNHGKKGVSVWLRHVMKKADGERLAGIASAEEDFSDVEATAEFLNSVDPALPDWLK